MRPSRFRWEVVVYFNIHETTHNVIAENIETIVEWGRGQNGVIVMATRKEKVEEA